MTLPYSVELNDIPMMIVQHHESDYLLKRAIDQFDRLYAEGEERAKIMALAIHPYISGQPHRIKYLEAIYDYVSRFDGVLHWNGVEILDWYRSVAKRDQLSAGREPGSRPLGRNRLRIAKRAEVNPLSGIMQFSALQRVSARHSSAKKRKSVRYLMWPAPVGLLTYG